MNKKLLKLLIIFGSIALVWSILFVAPRPQSVRGTNPLMIESGTRPILIAHGGGNLEFPDNTLEAFYHAYSVDSNVMMETDVSLTKDGIIILTHDTTLDRKTTLQYAPVIEINYSDLIQNEVDFSYHNQVSPNSNGFNVSGEFIQYKNYLGETVTPLDVSYPTGVTPRHSTKFLSTTLEELIKAFPNNLINVEIKQTGEIGLLALTKVIELLDELNEEFNTYDRIVLASFHKEVFEEMIRLQQTSHPNLKYSPETMGVVKFYVLQLLGISLFYNDPITVLQVPTGQYGLSLSNKGFIRTAHRHNIAVHYWTIDDPDVMRMLIKNGADGIMTNRPTLLKQVYDEFFE
ncbi:MAG TPA: glycerophosphodiester phosphodiesterase family protein [Bacilli bacterium]|nr:glycerophosphodiester phosphodiesterase family protein [Bacilli bacterium]